jgi:hypothetical protein
MEISKNAFKFYVRVHLCLLFLKKYLRIKFVLGTLEFLNLTKCFKYLV